MRKYLKKKNLSRSEPYPIYLKEAKHSQRHGLDKMGMPPTTTQRM